MKRFRHILITAHSFDWLLLTHNHKPFLSEMAEKPLDKQAIFYGNVQNGIDGHNVDVRRKCRRILSVIDRQLFGQSRINPVFTLRRYVAHLMMWTQPLSKIQSQSIFKFISAIVKAEDVIGG